MESYNTDCLYQVDQELDERLRLLRFASEGQKKDLHKQIVKSGHKNDSKSKPLKKKSSPPNYMPKNEDLSLDLSSFRSQDSPKYDPTVYESKSSRNSTSNRALDENDINSELHNLNSLTSVSASVMQQNVQKAVTINENTPEENKDMERDMDDDMLFDEFLDNATKLRIKSLSSKLLALNQTLSMVQEECKQLRQEKRDSYLRAQKAEAECSTLRKTLVSTQQQLTRQQDSNKNLQDQLKQKTSNCQALTKELSNFRSIESDFKSSQSTKETLLNRTKGENATLKEQISEIKARHKEELAQVNEKSSESNKKSRQLERQNKNLSLLVKKQEKLLAVITEQRDNIAIAKAAASLEDKFLKIISPLQSTEK